MLEGCREVKVTLARSRIQGSTRTIWLLPAPRTLGIAASLFAVMTLMTSSALTENTAEQSGFDRPLPEWRKGPVRYLLSGEKDYRYSRLATMKERSAFIESFWKHLDAKPETLENEFRAHFRQRVHDASRLFNEGNEPGWKTVRGKVLLVAGYPRRWARAAEGKEVWLYSFAFPVKQPQHLTPYRRVVPTLYFTVTFRRSKKGEYKLAGSGGQLNGRQLLKHFRRLDAAEAARLSIRTTSAPPLEEGEITSLGLIMQDQTEISEKLAAEARRGPPAVQRLRHLAEQGIYPTDLDVQATFAYRKDDHAFTMVLITLKVSKGKGAMQWPPTGDVFLFLRPHSLSDPAGEPWDTYEENPRIYYRDEVAGSVTYLTGLRRRPGQHQIQALFSVGDRQLTGGIVQEVTVPDFDQGRLTMSSIFLARSVTHENNFVPGPYYIFGPLGKYLQVKPFPTSTLDRGEEAILYYEVYQPDGGSALGGQPGFRIKVRVERKDQGGHWALWTQSGPKVPTVLDEEGKCFCEKLLFQGLEKWPSGIYRVTVMAESDSRAETTASSVEFDLR